jgi:hypothetical protein
MSDALDGKDDLGQVGRRRALMAGTVAVAAGAGTLLAGSSAAVAQVCEPVRPGTKEITFAVSSSTSFENLVVIMKEVLTLPELPGIKGCRPCLSGLDKFAFLSKVLGQQG